jgi:hypothetical protein
MKNAVPSISVMNLDRAITEPFKRYLNFHTRLNAEMPILSGLANDASKRLAMSPEGTLSQMMGTADPSWKKTPPIKNSYAQNLAANLFPQIASLGIISVHSAMDDFIVGVDAELARFNRLVDESDRVSSEEGSEPLVRIGERYNLNLSISKTDASLLKYFRLIRNSLAHRDRRASQNLADHSCSPDLRSAKADFKRVGGIELPEFKADQTIRIHPKLAVFNSILVREVGRKVDKSIVGHLGKEGLVQMAIHHFFRKSDPLRTPAYTSPEAVLNTALASRYLVGITDENSARNVAKNCGCWRDCLVGYKVHYGGR